MEAAPIVDSALARTAGHLMAAKMFSLASCVMLFYDIVLTFGDEVEKVWRKKFTPVTFLWFMASFNRYLSPLGYIVIIVSFHDPWPKSICNRYVLFPEALKVCTSVAIGIIFILRLYAIYSGSRIIVVCAGLLLAAQLGVKTWAFTDGTSLSLPPGLTGCILVGKSPPGERFVYTWIAELVFDSVIFFATLGRTFYLYHTTKRNTSTLIELIMRDGIIYFAVIFVANLVTVLIFLFAPPDIKAINASFSTLITSLMVSRLMLNLRGFLEHDRRVSVLPPSQYGFEMRASTRASSGVSKDPV
ncbi:hypothetical protein PLEOSDRAFT_163045 [Pleurotus ostreatus PC15]|uniref:DUF6533 domain-containing protein n=1 Tax=Pleurotus ostreatus (strain PC15) TaxID=1137138 RepID=A0A067N584_PLEO1|nr:hypothetical protein PLEOSDRAFT_163045 [Pleurotus ostreatus PC15]